MHSAIDDMSDTPTPQEILRTLLIVNRLVSPVERYRSAQAETAGKSYDTLSVGRFRGLKWGSRT